MVNSVGKSLSRDLRNGKRAKKVAKMHLPPKIMKNAPDKLIRKKIGDYYDTAKTTIAKMLITTLENFDEQQEWCKSLVFKFTF